MTHDMEGTRNSAFSLLAAMQIKETLLLNVVCKLILAVFRMQVSISTGRNRMRFCSVSNSPEGCTQIMTACLIRKAGDLVR